MSVETAAVAWIEANAHRLAGFRWFCSGFPASSGIRVKITGRDGYTFRACPLMVAAKGGPTDCWATGSLAILNGLPLEVAAEIVQAADGHVPFSHPVRAALLERLSPTPIDAAG